MYPPKHHVDKSQKNAFRVMEQFPLATLISRTDDDIVITHVPLILDRTRGRYGVLVGHMDRHNPHVAHLEHGRCSAIFHGPNAYLSPTVYATSQLPTWNSISVHVKGKVKKVRSKDVLRDSLVDMTEFLERGGERYKLDPLDGRMLRWLDLIVGFEMEIEELVGRFKLSQDKEQENIVRAKEHLLGSYGAASRELINQLLEAPNKGE